MRRILNLPHVGLCMLAQCMYGLAPSDEPSARYHKTTQLLYFNLREPPTLYVVLALLPNGITCYLNGALFCKQQ